MVTLSRVLTAVKIRNGLATGRRLFCQENPQVSSIVAVAAEDDSHYDNYLLKVTSSGVISLQENFEDPFSGSIYSEGQAVLFGNFFLRVNIINCTYKLDDKVAGV